MMNILGSSLVGLVGLALWIYGIALGFKAHWLMGILMIFGNLITIILALMSIFSGVNVPQVIVDWIKK